MLFSFFDKCKLVLAQQLIDLFDHQEYFDAPDLSGPGGISNLH